MRARLQFLNTARQESAISSHRSLSGRRALGELVRLHTGPGMAVSLWRECAGRIFSSVRVGAIAPLYRMEPYALAAKDRAPTGRRGLASIAESNASLLQAFSNIVHGAGMGTFSPGIALDGLWSFLLASDKNAC